MLAANLFFQLRKWITGDKPLVMSQQPLLVSQPAQFVQRADFDVEIERLEKNVEALNIKLESNRVASDDRGQKLQTQIQTVSDALNRRIDDLPSRIISELSTLGVLRRPTDPS